MESAKKLVVCSSGAMTSAKPVDCFAEGWRGLEILFVLVAGIVQSLFIL